MLKSMLKSMKSKRPRLCSCHGLVHVTVFTARNCTSGMLSANLKKMLSPFSGQGLTKVTKPWLSSHGFKASGMGSK